MSQLEIAAHSNRRLLYASSKEMEHCAIAHACSICKQLGIAAHGHTPPLRLLKMEYHPKVQANLVCGQTLLGLSCLPVACL
eukprot:1147400-Pelagomonas_calceolata.AAC.7